jgi:mannose-6-phosphate isomerase-like protein (cupin superfamily)
MKSLILTLLLLINVSFIANAQSRVILKRTLSDVAVGNGDLEGKLVQYKPIFGSGDADYQAVKGITRYGSIEIDSGGSGKLVKYKNEEQIIFILEGTGNLIYKNQVVPVAENDFIYIPSGVKHGLTNPRERTLKAMIMGFKIPDDSLIKATPHLMIANAGEVPFQVLGSHGPTTQFQLLMGTTESKRDRLAAAMQINSLFIMDFAAGGTNIPHRHTKEEEIYFVLRGTGEMVAGETSDGKEMRYPAREGDAFYFPPNTLIGFYSSTKEGEEHARILAVRSKYIF